MNVSRFEYIDAGIQADPSDSPYRLAEEHRRRRARAETEREKRELLTIEGTALLFGKGQSTIRRAAAKELVPVRFQITSFLGGPTARLFLIEDAARYWGEPDVSVLETLRETGHHISIDGLLWAILSPTPPLEVVQVGEPSGRLAG